MTMMCCLLWNVEANAWEWKRAPSGIFFRLALYCARRARGIMYREKDSYGSYIQFI
jgi:hypothetical protein